MKLEELTGSIVHLSYKSQRKLASTFLRFQEHYESSEFRGRVFELEDFMWWYMNNTEEGVEKGKFTYGKDFEGFNIPSVALEPFYGGKFNPLSKKERKILELFEKRRGQRFYIIATYKSDGKKRQRKTLKHEIAHGLFYTNPRYKEEVLRVLNKIDAKKLREIKHFLKNEKYHPDVLQDETHAYIISGLSNLREFGIKTRDLYEVKKQLNEIFQRHYPLY